MPIQTQCCGIVLLIIIFYFYKSQKSLKLNTERAFRNCFFVTSGSLVMDIISCVVIRMRDNLPSLFVDIVCKTYLVTLVTLAFYALNYIMSDLYAKKSDLKNLMMYYGTIGGASLILIYALPIYYYEDAANNVLYSYGPSDYATYAFALITIMVAIYMLFKEKKKMRRRRRYAVLVWLAVWLIAAVVQFFVPQQLLVGFASAVGMLVLFTAIENPGNNIDRRTGLFNQGAFSLYTKQLYDNEINFSLLTMSLEHLSAKTMNAELERTVIAEIAEYFSIFREVLAFNISSGEVILLFSEKGQTEESKMKIIRNVRERFEQGWGENKEFIVSPSWIYVPDSTLAKNPDDLLYLIRYAKKNSKELEESGYTEVTSVIANNLYREKEIEELISDAIENDRLEVWYQPIYSTASKKFTCAEALVRIRNVDGILIMPGAFIDIAERNGSILQIGEIVFRKVCRFISENDIKRYGVNYIEVNLSVIQCSYKHLAKDFIGIMKEYGVSADQINLEITESASMKAKNIFMDNMKELMDYGVDFSLDDFGTGHSNLDYITNMPVDIVKFDKGMTDAYFENEKARYVMDAATNMIHGMDLKIVSEGIETLDQYVMMNDLGINYIQGYYFSKPLPEKEYLAFVKEKSGSKQN